MVAVGRSRERRYDCQNWRADVSAILTDDGSMVEWVKYSAYGVPFGLPAGDTDSDGDWDGDDKGRIGSGAYDVRKDVNLDGVEDSDDVDQGNAVTGGNHALGRGVLSAGGPGGAVGNRRGYAGYEYAPELEGTGAAGRHLYHVRHRVYDADVGRWTRRDPLGYVDGMGLYEYVGGMAVVLTDVWGLRSLPCGSSPCSTQPGSERTQPLTPLFAQINRSIPPYLRIKGNCLSPGALDDPVVQQAIAYAQAACQGECSVININCIKKCDVAYTIGCTITIGPPCNPASRTNTSTLAHELIHVAQNCIYGDINDSPRTTRCDERICRELDAYKQANQCGRNMPPALATSCCDRACDSVMTDAPGCFVNKAACVTRCAALWAAPPGTGSCSDGHYWPPLPPTAPPPVTPVPPSISPVPPSNMPEPCPPTIPLPPGGPRRIY